MVDKKNILQENHSQRASDTTLKCVLLGSKSLNSWIIHSIIWSTLLLRFLMCIDALTLLYIASLPSFWEICSLNMVNSVLLTTVMIFVRKYLSESSCLVGSRRRVVERGSRGISKCCLRELSVICNFILLACLKILSPGNFYIHTILTHHPLLTLLLSYNWILIQLVAYFNIIYQINVNFLISMIQRHNWNKIVSYGWFMRDMYVSSPDDVLQACSRCYTALLQSSQK